MRSRMYQSIAHKLLKHFKKTVLDVKDKAVKVVKAPVYKYRKLRVWLRSKGAQYLEIAPYLKYYGAYLVVYGFLLNYTLHILLSFPLTPYTVPAWGITYYFIKEESTEILTMLINTWKGRR